MLTVENLSKTFGKTDAVRDVSCAIGEGEIYALIGPNGSGKTTIIKLVAGLLRPTGGRITVGGHDVVCEPERSKSQIGYIPDDPVVWENMTGEEFLHMTGALFGVPERTRMRRIPELLSIFGLAGIEKEYFEQYSRGNKQKFTILAALLHDPKLLLIDEPIVGLDPKSAEVAEKLFSDFRKSGGSILVVTHTLPVAERIADRIGVLERGVLVAEDTLAGLRTRANAGVSASLEEVYKALTSP